MDAAKSFLFDNIKTTSIGIGVVLGTITLWKIMSRKKKRSQTGDAATRNSIATKVCGEDYPRDTVIIHGFDKGDFAPNMGHFVMKLETYLRVAKIPFEPIFGMNLGPKSKLPWIEYNGVTMGDSQMIINFLNKEFNINLNKSLSKEDRAVAWAIQKWVEEFTYHLNVYTRWCLLSNDMRQVMPSISKAWLSIITRFVRKAQYTIGTARHTKEEIHEMMVFDLRQLAVILGNKTFLMGTDEPTEVDCAVFGILSQVRWHTPDSCPGKQALMGELVNLKEFTDRMKEQYWPDWNERICKLSGSKKI